MLLLCHADQQWGRSAAALQQALTTLAASQPTKRPRTRSPHARLQPSLGIPQAQHVSSATAARQADALAVPSNPEDVHTADGSALHEGAPPGLHAAGAEGTDTAASQSDQARLKHVAAQDALGIGAGLSEQGMSGQALQFAHDLLGNALPRFASAFSAAVGLPGAWTRPTLMPSSAAAHYFEVTCCAECLHSHSTSHLIGSHCQSGCKLPVTGRQHCTCHNFTCQPLAEAR